MTRIWRMPPWRLSGSGAIGRRYSTINRLRFKRRSMWILSWRSRGLFAPQPERLLGRSVGEAKQYGLRLCFMRDAIPRRHDENIACLPLQYGIAGARSTLALHNAINR